jgi:hypothetical protein
VGGNGGDVVSVADAMTAAYRFIVFTGVTLFDEFRSNPRFSIPSAAEVVAAVFGIFHILNRSKKKKEKSNFPHSFSRHLFLYVILVPLLLLLIILPDDSNTIILPLPVRLVSSSTRKTLRRYIYCHIYVYFAVSVDVHKLSFFFIVVALSCIGTFIRCER